MGQSIRGRGRVSLALFLQLTVVFCRFFISEAFEEKVLVQPVGK